MKYLTLLRYQGFAILHIFYAGSIVELPWPCQVLSSYVGPVAAGGSPLPGEQPRPVDLGLSAHTANAECQQGLEHFNID